MDAYTASGWRPPTLPVATSILKTSVKTKKKKQLKLSEALQAKTVTLQTISENHPLSTHPSKSPLEGDTAELRKEISTLKKQCLTLEAQRNEAFEELDKVLSAPQEHVNVYTSKIKELEAQRNDALRAMEKLSAAPKGQANVYLAKIKELEEQRNEAFEALDQVFSAPQPQATEYLAQIKELTAQKRILEDRCKTFSAWAEQQRLECSKQSADCQHHKRNCEQLTESLTAFYAKHSTLYAQHKGLESEIEKIKASMACPTPVPQPTPDLAARSADLCTETVTELKAAHTNALEMQHRAISAEKTVQTLLGVKALIQSAPVALELSTKTRSILESAIDVLTLANEASTQGSVQECMRQVCSALADLGDEASSHSMTARGWLAKRDSVLRSR
jgi:hypothetical protein